MNRKEFIEIKFESIKDIIVNQTKLMVDDEFPPHMIDEINSTTIETATKLYQFDKNQVNELKKLANLS